jgi:hypothetical protein
MGRKSISNEKRIEIATLLKVYPTIAEVAKKANVSRHCVINIAQKIDNGEPLGNRSGQGRRRLSTAVDDRSLKIMAKKNRTKSSKVLASEWGQSIGKTVSSVTVRRRLGEMGMKSYVQKRKPFRNRRQIKKRYEWCQRMQVWSDEQWAKVIWSDESHFELINRKNRVMVRRYQHEEDLPLSYQLRQQGGGGSVSVWGCFSAKGPGPILFYDGRLNATAYTTLLSAALPQFIEDQFSDQNCDCFFQQDNAPCHTARSTVQWFEEQQIRVLPWPATSPDLNPIENVWSIIDQGLVKMKIGSITELKTAITNIWYEIDKEVWLKLSQSLRGRVSKVLKLKGRSSSTY